MPEYLFEILTHFGMLSGMQNETPGLLIAFDGIDSSGKHTQVKELSTRLRYIGHTVHHFETPDYTTPSGQELKRRLQNKDGSWQQTPWEDKMKLFATNRMEHKAELYNALHHGEIVIYDRYVASSLTFITVEALSANETDLFRDKTQETIRRLEYEHNGMPLEHASLFLDVPPDVTAALLEHRKTRRQDDDEYTDHLEVQRRLYNEYDVLCTQQPDRYLRIKCVIGDELLPVDAVAELIWETLRLKFPSLERIHTQP